MTFGIDVFKRRLTIFASKQAVVDQFSNAAAAKPLNKPRLFRYLPVIMLACLAMFFLSRTDFFNNEQDDWQSPVVREVIPRPEHWAMPIDRRFNLHRMQPDLYRSALPDSAALPALKELGITTVINFHRRSDSSWLDDPQIRRIHLPLHHPDRFDDADVIKVLRAIRQAQVDGAVLIHCEHGQNRTGLIAALYRIIYQGWSKEQARAEMFGGGFGDRNRLDDADQFLRRVDTDAIKSALERGACSTSSWAWCAIKARLL